MSQDLFEISKTAIDAGIDAWIGPPAGITMGFALIAGFMSRGLLERVEYDVQGENWIHRRYRGRIVQPDPELGDYDFFFGMRIF